jgi:3-oxo-5-alpha-steroid 4-dehydrogenase 1
MVLHYLLAQYELFLLVMAALAVVVFVSLNFIEVGYGITINKKWGFSINNKIAWLCMEMPVFILMTVLCLCSPRMFPFHLEMALVPFIIFLFFQTHYVRRSFIFPFLLKGKSKMPVVVMFMGVLFNLCNAFMQGGWLFFQSPEGMYSVDWLWTPQFIIGAIIFFGGMTLNIQSDKIIQNLRKQGDSKHYLPSKGFFKYVTGAHYFGEVIEWIGFAILTWSLSGAVFALWTCANLIPRANAIFNKYKAMFGEQTIKEKKLKRIFPWIY